MKRRDHRFVLKVAGFHYCCGCGLIALGNQATRREMNKPCPGHDDDE